VQHRWVTAKNQYPDVSVRGSLAAVDVVARAAGARPLVLIVNDGDTDDPATHTNTAYGWAKTYTNVFRTGLPGTSAKYQATYLGSLENFLAGRVTTSTNHSIGYDRAAESHYQELQLRERTYPAPPAVFLVREYYGGLCNGVQDCTDVSRQQRLEAALAQGVAIGPDVVVIQGPGLWSPPADVVGNANAVANDTVEALEHHPGPLANFPHTLLVIAILALLLVVPGGLARRWFGLDSTIDRFALIPGISVVLIMLAGVGTLAVWRGPLTTTKGWAVVVVAIGTGVALRFADVWLRRPLDAFGRFFNDLFAIFSNRDFSVLMGYQFLAQAGQGVVQGAIFKALVFGGEKGFDISVAPSADYLLKVVLALYIPYTFLSPFVGVFIDRFERRRVAWWADILSAALVTLIVILVVFPLGSGSPEHRTWPTVGLIVGLLVAQSVARIALAVKSAALPDVLSGKDLLQGNGLSQAGGGLAQVFGIGVGTIVAGQIAPWIGVLFGAAVLLVGAVVSRQMRRVEARRHETSLGQEVRRIIRTVVAGVEEVAGRPAAALGLSAFQMLRYQFWGFVLMTFALYAKNLVQGGNADTLSQILSGVGGLVGGALGLIVAQRLKDRVPPIRLLLGSMALLGAATVVLGGILTVAAFAALLFVGFFSFFLGKISTDTITQQAMPDDFRGRAFALYDIAYNLGFIVPAAILSVIWIEGDAARTREILVASGAIFLILTAFVAAWSRRIRSDLAPQDDLVGDEAVELATSTES
jgi:MFS family permease